VSFLVNPYWYASAGCTDTDALAFLTAAGITDPTITSAICTLVTSMKANGTWAKCNAIYPFVGGTSFTTKFNLKSTSTFELTFGGGWSYALTGITPNGINGYSETFLKPSVVLGANSGHLSYYSRTNSAVLNELPMGVTNAVGTSQFSLVVRRTDNSNSFRATESGGTTGSTSSTSTDSRGLTLGSITSATSRKIYKNGTLLNTNSSNITWSRINGNIFIGAVNIFDQVTAAFYTNKECAFASIGAGLTDAEAATLYTDVQAFQTTLGRNV
jgi:hypothetical protein